MADSRRFFLSLFRRVRVDGFREPGLEAGAVLRRKMREEATDAAMLGGLRVVTATVVETIMGRLGPAFEGVVYLLVLRNGKKGVADWGRSKTLRKSLTLLPAREPELRAIPDFLLSPVLSGSSAPG